MPGLQWRPRPTRSQSRRYRVGERPVTDRRTAVGDRDGVREAVPGCQRPAMRHGLPDRQERRGNRRIERRRGVADLRIAGGVLPRPGRAGVGDRATREAGEDRSRDDEGDAAPRTHGQGHANRRPGAMRWCRGGALFRGLRCPNGSRPIELRRQRVGEGGMRRLLVAQIGDYDPIGYFLTGLWRRLGRFVGLDDRDQGRSREVVGGRA